MKRLQIQKRLLSEKPTSYRKQEVLKLENQLIESSELDRIEYQEKIMRARNTGTIFKHMKSLKKSPSLPKLLIKENQQSTKMQEQVDDLKILAVKKTFWQVQNDLNGIEQWVNENKMKLAMDKCAKLSIRGQTQN